MTALPLRDFSDPATIRLISTAYITEPALTPLADDAAALAILEEVEALTSARRTTRLPMPGGVSARELLTDAQGYGWTFVNAAFCYTRAGGNRFNGPERGAWYACHGADAAVTAQAEVAWHLGRELRATGVWHNTTSYRELIAGFATRLDDLTARPDAPCLDPDPAVGYPAGQAVARAILARGGNGVLYPSVRRAGGSCLAAFRPHLVQNLRQGETWIFVWSGDPEPRITRR